MRICGYFDVDCHSFLTMSSYLSHESERGWQEFVLPVIMQRLESAC